MKMNQPMRMTQPLAFALLTLGLVSAPLLHAQPDRSTGGADREALRERMDVMAVGFLTEELELDAETAQVFWPIFNAHKALRSAAKQREKAAKMALATFDEGSQAEFNELLGALESAEVENAKLRADFLRKLADTFDPQFAVRCVRAQRDFDQRMRERFQERMSQEDRRALGKMGRGPGRQRPR